MLKRSSIFFLFCYFSVIACKEKKNVSESSLDKTKETGNLILQPILSSNDPTSTGLLIIRDTIFWFTPASPKHNHYYARNFFYDSQLRKFKLNSSLGESSADSINTLIAKHEKSSVFLRSLGNPGIKYVLSQEKTARDSVIQKLIKTDTKCQRFAGKYYYIDSKDLPRYINVYDTIANRVDSFSLGERFFEITDFFLYDMDKDLNPEIFILNTGHVPREDWISYDIFSFRRDSVATIVK